MAQQSNRKTHEFIAMHKSTLDEGEKLTSEQLFTLYARAKREVQPGSIAEKAALEGAVVKSVSTNK